MIALDGRTVIVDCGDSRLSPFGGAELSGTLRHVEGDRFALVVGADVYPFRAADALDVGLRA